MNYMIRKAVRADSETIAAYNMALAKETEHIALDPDRAVRGVNGMFDDVTRGFYLVAESDGTIVGQLMITYEWSDWRNGVFWWIQSVYVHKDFRATGVFRKLYDSIIEMARRQGDVCGVRLYAEKDNEHANAVYKKLGMTVTNYDLLEVDFILKR